MTDEFINNISENESQVSDDRGSSESRINRRKFFGEAGKKLLLASVGAGLILPAAAAEHPNKFNLTKLDADTERETAEPPEPLPPAKRMGFAIVGLGHLSLDQIIPAFGSCKKSRLAALVSGHREKALTIAAEHGLQEKDVYDYSNFDTIKDNPNVDIVYIVLPNSMHAEYTARAAKAGKHVLTEKPMATSARDCQSMIDVCNQTNKKLMVAYRIQYEPTNRAIRAMVRSNEYGKVKMIDASNGQNQGDPNQWRHKIALAGGGALPDIGIYCLNTIRALLGEEPNEVFATTYSTPGDPRFTQVEENIAFQLKFPSGVIANCGSGYGYHESRRYRVYAETGWYGLDPAFSYDGLQLQLSHAKGKTEYTETPKIGAKNQFAVEMDHMADCVINDKRPHTPGEEGLQDQKIIEALYLSAAQRKPIILPTITTIDTYRGPQPV